MQGQVESFAVATTLSAYRGVFVSAANTVAYPTSDAVLPIGITLDTVLDVNQSIPVQINGIAKMLFNDTVTAGALVACDTSGRGIPQALGLTATSTTLSKAVIGILVDAKANTTATVARVLIMPQYVR